MTAATGLGNPSSEVLQLAQQYVDQARASAALANPQRQLTDQMQNVINALMAQELQSSGSSSSGAPAGMNWLQAIAYAMGIALGNMANKLANESQNLQSLSGSASGSGAQQFEAALAQFQADSQVFSMLENAFSTAIKALGEGNTTMASRTS
jgi:hypothetical protein